MNILIISTGTGLQFDFGPAIANCILKEKKEKQVYLRLAMKDLSEVSRISINKTKTKKNFPVALQY